MARIQANNGNEYESVRVIIDKEQYPIAYRAKIEELVEQGCYDTIEDAEQDNPNFDIELELYYDKHSGLFGVEAEAISSDATSICSPYSGEYMLDYIEE